jgi:hypothetical protein
VATTDTEQTLSLTAYVINDRAPEIRPGERRRDWMERTRDRFAYRCLPLTIANQSGWDLLCPVSFEAIWNGGDSMHDLYIKSDDPEPGAVSHFGHGILTFHVSVLFRTTAGHNLWVKGPPNQPRDGISPLEGIVETDWSSATFTMNWKLTRPRHKVAFSRGEAFCRILPYPRHYLNRFETARVAIDESPETRARFEEWSRQRLQFNEGLKSGDPQARRTGWQKDYHHGRDALGERFEEHETKVRVKPFPET